MVIEWEGVMPAVTTKFKIDNTLNLEIFAVNIKAQLDAGVTDITLRGTLGEASTLNDDKKRILIRKSVEVLDGKAPIIIKVAEQTTKDAIEAVAKAEEDDAEDLMMLPPMKYNASDRKTVAYFREVARSTKLPITENVRVPRLSLIGEERKRVLQIIETGIKNRPILPNYKELNTLVG